jgi:hypothetical protein
MIAQSRSMLRADEKCVRTWRCAASPSEAASAGSRRRRSIARAIPSTSRSPTSSPVSPPRTTSGMPPCRVETTGSPDAPASSIETGVPSTAPEEASTECWTKRRAAHLFGDRLVRLASEEGYGVAYGESFGKSPAVFDERPVADHAQARGGILAEHAREGVERELRPFHFDEARDGDDDGRRPRRLGPAEHLAVDPARVYVHPFGRRAERDQLFAHRARDDNQPGGPPEQLAVARGVPAQERAARSGRSRGSVRRAAGRVAGRRP